MADMIGDAMAFLRQQSAQRQQALAAEAAGRAAELEARSVGPGRDPGPTNLDVGSRGPNAAARGLGRSAAPRTPGPSIPGDVAGDARDTADAQRIAYDQRPDIRDERLRRSTAAGLVAENEQALRDRPDTSIASARQGSPYGEFGAPSMDPREQMARAAAGDSASRLRAYLMSRSGQLGQGNPMGGSITGDGFNPLATERGPRSREEALAILGRQGRLYTPIAQPAPVAALPEQAPGVPAGAPDIDELAKQRQLAQIEQAGAGTAAALQGVQVPYPGVQGGAGQSGNAPAPPGAGPAITRAADQTVAALQGTQVSYPTPGAPPAPAPGGIDVSGSLPPTGPASTANVVPQAPAVADLDRAAMMEYLRSRYGGL